MTYVVHHHHKYILQNPAQLNLCAATVHALTSCCVNIGDVLRHLDSVVVQYRPNSYAAAKLLKVTMSFKV